MDPTVCDHVSSKRFRGKDEPTEDMPPPKPKRFKPKPARCPCTCSQPETKVVLVTDDDPEPEEFVHRCECNLCGDHNGCRTRIHYVRLMFIGPTCEACIDHFQQKTAMTTWTCLSIHHKIKSLASSSVDGWVFICCVDLIYIYTYIYISLHRV